MKISHRVQLKELDERFAKEPEWWDGCLIRVAMGESLWDIAADYIYIGSVLRHWVKANDARESAYIDAVERRKEGWTDKLQTRTARAAFATVDQALTGDGGALEISQWSPALLAACDTAEFGPHGQIYKVKMDSGKALDRLGKYVGLDKSGEANINIYSLVGILSGLPKAGVEALPDAPKQITDVEDAVLVTDAGEIVLEVTDATHDPREQHGNPPPRNISPAVGERTMERV